MASAHTVVIDDAQMPDAPVAGIVILGERERLPRVEPPVIEMSALVRPPYRDHVTRHGSIAAVKAGRRALSG